MLYQLIYASESTPSFKSSEVDALLEQARRNNEQRDLTGLLVFDSRRFLQAVEGDRATLSRLYGRLVADPRHTHLVILGMTAIERRQFSRWKMGYAAGDAARRALYLRHGTSASFEPQQMTAASALALLNEFAEVQGAVVV